MKDSTTGKRSERIDLNALTVNEKLPYVPAEIHAVAVEMEQGVATGSGPKESWEDGGELGGTVDWD